MYPLRAYVLTVEPDGGRRRTAMQSKLRNARFSWEFFEGVRVGSSENTVAYSPWRNIFLNNRNVTPPELACYASHRAIWETVASGQHEAALIFEDDARIIDEEAFYAALEDVLADLPSFDLVKFFDYKPKRVVLTKHIGRTMLVSHKMIATGAVGYLITRSAARKLLDARSSVFRAVDDDWTHAWELGVRIWSVEPNPVATEEDGESLIQTSRQHSRLERGPLRSTWNVLLTAYKQMKTAGYHRHLSRS